MPSVRVDAPTALLPSGKERLAPGTVRDRGPSRLRVGDVGELGDAHRRDRAARESPGVGTVGTVSRVIADYFDCSLARWTSCSRAVIAAISRGVTDLSG